MSHERPRVTNETVTGAVVLEREREVALQDFRARVHNDGIHAHKPKRRPRPPLQVIHENVAQTQRQEAWSAATRHQRTNSKQWTTQRKMIPSLTSSCHARDEGRGPQVLAQRHNTVILGPTTQTSGNGAQDNAPAYPSFDHGPR